MNRLGILFAVAVIAMVGTTVASASVIGTYNFFGLVDLPAPATSVAPGVTVSNLIEGFGSRFTVVNTPTTNTPGDVMRFQYYDRNYVSEAQAIAGEVYIQFTVTPSSAIDFETISWTGSADTTSASRHITFFVRSSADNYASTLDSKTYASLHPQYPASLDISYLGGVTSATTFRMYYYDDSNSGGLVFVDDLTINGVPEPATMGLLAMGGLALIRRRR